jgi:hypothetical protein
MLNLFLLLVAAGGSGGSGEPPLDLPTPAFAVDAGMLADVHFALEGPGSVPVKSGALTARGMFNRGAELRKLSSFAEIEDAQVVLFIALDRLPGVDVESRVQVGASSMLGTNSVQPSDPTYRVGRRYPIDDGLVHALVLEGGA